MIPAEHEGDSV